MTQSRITVRPARPSDIPAIYAISKSLTLTYPAEADTAKGFLVSGFGLETYRQFLTDTDLFFVIADKDKIAGFLLGFKDNRISRDIPVVRNIRRIQHTPFILCKQICVAREHTRKGLTASLYRHLMRKVDGTPIYASIVLEPENTASIRAHEKLGFRKQFEYIDSDHMRKGVWRSG